MILYGEDRFTPAQSASASRSPNLIPPCGLPGDALNVVFFHDSAEESPISRLARVRVGPYYPNARKGLKLARRVLERQRKDMRQIVMIADGKPSALTRADGKIYRDAFGLDPFIVSETFAEVAAYRKAGILIDTFMLAPNQISSASCGRSRRSATARPTSPPRASRPEPSWITWTRRRARSTNKSQFPITSPTIPRSISTLEVPTGH